MIDLNWYQALNHPFLTPPAWIFQPAWVVLYTLIFISLILYITKRTDKTKVLGYVLFCTQIIFNVAWVPVFFTFHNILLALAVIILLDILVFFNIKEFFLVSSKAAYFLMPYFFWILFATYLTVGFLLLN